MSIQQDFRYAFSRSGNVLTQLILINVVVWLLYSALFVFAGLFSAPGAFDAVHKWIAIPADVRTFLTRPWTAVTYFFLHQRIGLFHILFNMLWLYWFGKLIQEYIGAKRLLGLYVWGGLAGAGLYLVAYNLVPYFRTIMLSVEASGGSITMVGASASVLAVVVGAATLLPNYSFNLFILGPVKIVYIAAFSVVMSFFGVVGDNPGGNVAHLGGALFGFIIIKQLRAGTDWSKPVAWFVYGVKSLFKPRRKIKVSYRSEQSHRASARARERVRQGDNEFDEASQEEIDSILDKISTSGYESLTKLEKQKLFSASQKK